MGPVARELGPVKDIGMLLIGDRCELIEALGPA